MSRAIGFVIAVTLTFLAETANAGTVNVIDFDSTPNVLNGGSGNNFCLGYMFTTTQDVWVTDLGYFDAMKDGLAVTHEVGLWRLDGALLASTTVHSSDVLDGWFRFNPIGAIHLTAGESYIVGGMSGTNYDDPYAWSVTGMTVAPQIRYEEIRYLHTNTLAMPTENQTIVGELNGYFGASFRVSDTIATVPLPGAAHLGIALLAGVCVVATLKAKKPTIV